MSLSVCGQKMFQRVKVLLGQTPGGSPGPWRQRVQIVTVGFGAQFQEGRRSQRSLYLYKLTSYQFTHPSPATLPPLTNLPSVPSPIVQLLVLLTTSTSDSRDGR
jgi:hypothetical protein